MKVQVLGTGCPKCKTLAERTQQAADRTGVAIELEKVTDINDILDFGVMTTPALVVDGKVRISGKVPTIDEIGRLLGGADA